MAKKVSKKNGTSRKRRDLTVAAAEVARLGNQAEDLRGRIIKKTMELNELKSKLEKTETQLSTAYERLAQAKPQPAQEGSDFDSESEAEA